MNLSPFPVKETSPAFIREVASAPEDQVYFRDVFTLIKRQKGLFSLCFVVILSLSALYLVKSFPGYHVQQNLILKNEQEPVDYQYVLRLMSIFSSDLFFLNRLVEEVGDSTLTTEKLSSGMLTVKILPLGGFLLPSGSLSERYQLGLYVRTRRKEQAQAILQAWTRLSLQEVEKLNTGFQGEITKLENELQKAEESRQVILERWRRRVYGDRVLLLPEEKESSLLESYDFLREVIRRFTQELEKLGKDQNSDPRLIFYHQGLLEAYLELHTRLFQNQDREVNLLNQLNRAIQDYQKRISVLKQHILVVQPEEKIEVIFNWKDQLMLTAAISLGLALVVSLLAVILREATSFYLGSS